MSNLIIFTINYKKCAKIVELYDIIVIEGKEVINLKNVRLFFSILILSFAFLAIKDVDALSYGIVNFKTKSCSVNTNYNEYQTGRSGYTNGCYGADAAYLGTENGKVKFMLSGVVGLVNSSEVSLIDFVANEPTTYVSSYIVENGAIKHCISLDTKTSSFSCVKLGKNTVGLRENVYYLSYDGHYFYEYSVANFKKMIDDYKKGVRTNAYNKTAYYDYYQFVPHRTISNQTASSFNAYITNTSSKMYKLGSAFVNNQNTYGSNAALMFGVAGNESAWGTSYIAMDKNNLFGHGAVDSNPYYGSNGYNTPADSVKYHAKYFISEGFLDPCDWADTKGNGYNSSICLTGRYNGGALGNKASGINVRYASDPYWGEKAASNYYYLESSVGVSDYGYYTLGIKTDYGSYRVRKEANPNATILYETVPSSDYSFVILGKKTGTDGKLWYKVQTDPTLDSTRTKLIQDHGEYNFSNNYGYVSSDAVNVYVKGTKAIEDLTVTTYSITFDANGGKFSDNQNIKTLSVEKGKTPSVANPSRTGYTFDGWTPTITAAAKNITYKAVWKVNTYTITFDADGGKFEDGKTVKSLTVDYGVVPAPPIPERNGYIFDGWDKILSIASANTTYKALWEKEAEPDETGLIKKDGTFNLSSLTKKDDNIVLTGYNTINGINNNLDTEISYEVIFTEVDTNKEIILKATRLKDQLPYNVYSIDGKDYKYSWFSLNIDLDKLNPGTYHMHIVSKTDKYYSKNLINNKTYSEQITGFTNQSGKNVIIKNNYNYLGSPIELTVRNEALALKTATSSYNQFDTFTEFEFNDDLLHLRGLTYSYGMDLSKSKTIKRYIIFENKSDFKTYKYELGSITNGDYKAILPVKDNLDKTRAWYDKKIDISTIPIGNYVIYITTEANVTDISELTEKLGRKLTNVTNTIKDKDYSFSINNKKGNRIEMKVE